MLTLKEKMERSAAERLPLPAGRLPTQELARYKTFLKVETHRLKISHRGGAGGLEICQGRAALIDLLVRYMWDAVKQNISAQAQREFSAIALVAVGGYGRAELNPFSDIDFMFLHEGQVGAVNKPLPILARLMDGILYPLWDIGLKIGYTVRSVEESVIAAQNDMQSKTSLIEARLITGSEALFKKLQKAVINKCVAGYEDKYIAARLEDQAARHAKFGNSPCMQEPNIKNGCGGLRDHQNLLWMAFFKYRTRSLAEMQAQELISEAERKQLGTAYDYLLRVRNELHYHTDRAMDVLNKSLQPAVAHNLGFLDRSPSTRLEKFMREVYTHARNIYLINRTLEQRLALQPAPKRLQFIRGLIGRRREEPQVVDGFKFVDGYIHAATPRVFRDQPRRLMRVFLYAQQRGLRLHPDLAQMIRNQLSLVDRAFLYDEHARETFLGILNQRGNVAPVLRQMHETGFLGKYLPEFGKLTCLVQHEFYHQYTADEHTLRCLEQLDRVWEAKTEPYAHYAPLFQGVERPYLLYLALLLHDTGKADGHGRHALVSSELAKRAATRLGLDGAVTHTLRLVIENHLLMASTSQRRDLADPAVIRGFAKQIQNTEALVLLTLHTFADTLATSDKLWNDFKDSLLWTLYQGALPLLKGGTEFLRAEEKQRELLEEEIRRLLPEEVSVEELEAHFTTLPPRYFEIHSAAEILRDLSVVHRFLDLQLSEEEKNALEPILDWHNEPDRAYTVAKVCTWDRTGLFSNITGSFSAARLNILSAQIFTRTDGIVLDTFFVTDAKTGTLANKEEREKFQQVLEKVLTGGEVDFAAMIARQKGARPLYQSYEGDRMQTQVSFDNEASDERTSIEVETEDRLGLLHAISQALAEANLNISAAKIVTEKGAAIDTFYVSEQGGKKIVDTGRQEFIERKIRDAINRLA
jgi:[protein-PII] uridylyltransferase